jgi:hypothetical protein
MSAPAKIEPSVVSPEEVKRRVVEYRRLGFQRCAPAHVVYHDDHLDCPWAGCDVRIAGVDFRLDSQGDGARLAEWVAAWWNGPGLVGRCPGCGRHVLFGLEGKRAVSDLSSWGTAVLPDDWHQKAHLVDRVGQTGGGCRV